MADSVSYINGYELKDANARERLGKLETVKYPSLTEAQKTEIYNLAKLYRNSYQNAFYYKDLGRTRNIFATGECFMDDGRVTVNCNLYAQLVWGGISPLTLAGLAASYDGSIVKAFDWGFYFDFPYRPAYGVTKSDGSLYGFKKPNADSYEGSYSKNTYYTGTAAREDGQAFISFMDANDMALELYVKGFEVPMSDAQVGDLVFYDARDLEDDSADSFQKQAFRNISHVAVITNVTKKSEGKFTIYECTSANGASYPFAATYMSSGYDSDVVQSAALMKRVAMVARHPAAFGVAGNVPDKFVEI